MNTTQPKILHSIRNFPKFEYTSPSKIFYINQTTTVELINELIHRVKQCIQFTIVTKYDYTFNHPCLLQILFSKHMKTYLIIIETRYLPGNTCVLFQSIQLLLAIILSPLNLLQSWSDIKNELRHFLIHDLFSFQQVEQIQVVNIQQKFKRWFDTIFDHTSECYELYDHMNDNSNCICLHRPFTHTYDEWSLGIAIGFIYQQYFDTSFTYSNWNIGLYLHVPISSSSSSSSSNGHLNHNNNDNDMFNLQIQYETQCRSILNEYVIKECLAINKLALVLENPLLRKHTEEYLKNYYLDH